MLFDKKHMICNAATSVRKRNAPGLANDAVYLYDVAER